MPKLAEKGADIVVLGQMVQIMAQRLMNLTSMWAAVPFYDEKMLERVHSRNGCRDRTSDTHDTSVGIKIPSLRQGSYFPDVLWLRCKADKALTAFIWEASIHGLPTRSLNVLIKALGMSGVAKSQVRRLYGELDERVRAFMKREIEGDWPYLRPLRDLPLCRSITGALPHAWLKVR